MTKLELVRAAELLAAMDSTDRETVTAMSRAIKALQRQERPVSIRTLRHNLRLKGQLGDAVISALLESGTARLIAVNEGPGRSRTVIELIAKAEPIPPLQKLQSALGITRAELQSVAMQIRDLAESDHDVQGQVESQVRRMFSLAGKVCA